MRRKARHIALGVLLNLIGMITLFVIDGPTSFMNTPVKAEGISPQDSSQPRPCGTRSSTIAGCRSISTGSSVT